MKGIKLTISKANLALMPGSISDHIATEPKSLDCNTWYALHDPNGEPLGGFRNRQAADQAQARFPGSKLTALQLDNFTMIEPAPLATGSVHSNQPALENTTP